MVTQAIVMMAVAIKSMGTIKTLAATVEELKDKALPLLAQATELTATAQAMVRDAAPKVKAITDNLVDASDSVRTTAEQFGQTMTDVNLRTQRQVARVDGMLTATLTATSELADTIAEGIRVPALKIAAMATQAKAAVEGLVGRAKSMGAGFMAGKRRAG
jgi:ABC-type transporter Mla subunit MlaD